MPSAQFPTTGHTFVIGHRGGAGHAFENSIPAFRLAATPGSPASCDGVELDIHTTADGQFVVHHDPVLSTGEAIASLPLARVLALPLADGSTIPTLGAAL